MESRLYGLTTKDLRVLAYTLAVKNGKKHMFNCDKGVAGKDWLHGFLSRHPELSIRKPESTSAARAAGFNKQAVEQFFNILGNVYDEHKLPPDRIYNCDEIGISVVPKTRSKIITRKGRKQVVSITSADRGTTITIEICFSASGQYMPPIMVYPRKRMDPQLMLNAAPGAWGVYSDSGWMTAELFLGWFKKFIEFSGARPDRPVLLLLDGHSTHTQNLDVINEARSNGVIILCFPPHTTHRLQVADVAYMKPLSTYYDQEITAWLRSNSGMVVTPRQVAEIFGKAFVQASTVATAVNGFKKCGIWPYDPTVFSDIDFAPSLATDIPQTERVSTTEAFQKASTQDNEATALNRSLISTDASVVPETTMNATTHAKITSDATVEVSDKAIMDKPLMIEAEPEPGCSSWINNIGIDQRPTTPSSVFSVVSPQQVMPYPATRKISRVTRKREKTAIITSSLYKNELEKSIEKKRLVEDSKKRRKDAREQKKYKKTELTKKKKTNINTKNKKNHTSPEYDEEENNIPCFYCTGRYMESNEGWVACSLCGNWAHCHSDSWAR
ncbi:uncharacterized protein LOC126979466 [Leptidea sinapis]|uniref:uncharacterized protein LOC126979466 n=1 Tax=Leptidea sinapis TaxID=189913 RepID=UPI002136EDDC|nr:uncharacterized protein LOC126979466 [Leptidea sinapis]